MKYRLTKKSVIAAAVGAVLVLTLCIVVFNSAKRSPTTAEGVSAADIKVTEGNASVSDFANMCVYLYEQLSGEAILPVDIEGHDVSESVKKIYSLGLISENDVLVHSPDSAITREEAAVFLYAAMLRYNKNIRVSERETRLLLNGCYDNMSVTQKEATAFLYKIGAVKTNSSFYPTKMLSSDNAADWVNAAYRVYKGGHYVEFENGVSVECGITERELVEKMGQPTRLDGCIYGGELAKSYIYNTGKLYAIIYTDNGAVNGFFSNLGVKSTTDYMENSTDTAYYIPSTAVVVDVSAEQEKTQRTEFIEMINAYRAARGYAPLIESASFTALAEENSRSMAVNGIDMDIKQKAAAVSEKTIEDVYVKLTTSMIYDKVLLKGGNKTRYVGVGIDKSKTETCVTLLIDEENEVQTKDIDKSNRVQMSVVNDSEKQLPIYEFKTNLPQIYVEVERLPKQFLQAAAPVIASPQNEENIKKGEAVNIKIGNMNTEKCIVRVTNTETGENIVSSEIYADVFTVAPDILEDGYDYEINVSTDTGREEIFANSVTVRYGEAEKPVITSPHDYEHIDTDGITARWKSKYSDFIVSLYNDSGEILGVDRVIETTELYIGGLQDGGYRLEIMAMRRNTNIPLERTESKFFVQSASIEVVKTERTPEPNNYSTSVGSTITFGTSQYRNSRYSAVFGGTRVYSSKSEADANMVTVTVPVWKIGGDGTKYSSQMRVTVNRKIAAEVAEIFAEIYRGKEKFPIKSLGGYKWRSTATGSRSQHSYGTCIDINPDENYCIYNSGTTIGKFWRPNQNPYSITPDGDVMRAFKSRGWTWGGEWNSLKDYMHFSYLGG